MKIGNYKWVNCRKCGKQYVWTSTRGSHHNCETDRKNKIFGFIRLAKKFLGI